MTGLYPMMLVAWRPLLDPMSLHEPWQAMLLLPPLIIVITLVYKALKLPTLRRLGHETTQLALYIISLMAIAAIVLWVFVDIV